ncbi:MAG: sodium-dependent transporter [Thermoprotei archaeon]|nr:sodium-dependent transporter [Thermoprotei archaeon]
MGAREILPRIVERAPSSFAILMAVVGWSVGAGNYWRFSWRAANYGGGSFLLAYLVWLIFTAFVLAVAEYAIGRIGRGGPIFGPYNFAQKYKRFASFLGLWMAWCSFMILAYYWVVTGWIFTYMIFALTGTFTRPDFDAAATWNSIYQTWISVAIGVLMMVGSIIVTALGIRGITMVARVMFPILFILTAGLAIFSLTLPGASKGLEFYMVPKLETLIDPATWMQSLSQVIWSIGIAWGFFIAAGAWTRKRDDVTLLSFGNTVNDTAVAWMAGLAIIPLIFAVSATPMEDIKQAGTGLAFVALPRLFHEMGGLTGYLYGLIFFVAFWFAAFTSLYTIHEVTLRPLKDLGMPPWQAAVLTGVIAILIGIPTALSGTWLDYYDTVWGVIGLALGLAGIALIVGFLTNTETVRRELMAVEPKPLIPLGSWWNFLVKINVVIPIIFFIWWIAYWEWMRGWDAGLHTYYTFPGVLILIVGGIILYYVAGKVLERAGGGK